MVAEIRSALPELVQSYGSTQRSLDQKLAYFLQCDPHRVHVLNGASQLYPYLTAHPALAIRSRSSRGMGISRHRSGISGHQWTSGDGIDVMG